MNLLVVWDELTPQWLDRIAAETGANLMVSRSKDEAAEMISSAHVGLGFVPPALLRDASSMKWLQTAYAGVEGVLGVPWGNPEMILTNGSGIFGPNIAEQIIGMMISFTRGLHKARDAQKQRQWKWPYSFGELYGSRVGLLGYGDIGRETAKRLKVFGCQLTAIRRSPSEADEWVDAVYPWTELENVLPQLDFLVCSLPHTEATAGMLPLRRLQMLPKHAVVVNVGRGSLMPEPDLVEALETGCIAGAALDVTAVEPLPTESRLWELDNVVLTPHNSGQTPYHVERGLQIFFDNWQRFREGKALKNLVTPDLGY